VIKEHSRDETEVLTVDSLDTPIDLEKSNVFVSVNFVAWRVPDSALGRVAQKFSLVNTEEEAEVTNVEALCVVLCWQRGEVPGL